MHTYDAPSRLPYTSPIPAMRPVPETAGSHSSATPIYDALCAEYRRSFRTLPGDRSGEEEFGFRAFGTGPHGIGLRGTGSQGTGSQGTDSHSTGSYNPASYTSTSYGTRHGAGHQATGRGASSPTHHGQNTTSVWQPVARIPAALPPAPRREG